MTTARPALQAGTGIEEKEERKEKRNRGLKEMAIRYIYDGELYDDITDAIAEAFTEDDYEDFLNDDEPIRIGGLQYSAGFVQRRVDPVAFRCDYLDYIGTMDAEDAIEEFGIEIYDPKEYRYEPDGSEDDDATPEGIGF